MSKRSNTTICLRLIGLVKPLCGFMILAIVMGLLGHLCATFIPVLGITAFLSVLGISSFSLSAIFVAAAIFAVMRGALHYAEQACNHFIAFKLLALIRDKVFGALRQLCPAKLEGKDRGDLISIITSDIELLEVFYAHTISPIAIAILMSVVMCTYLGNFHIAYAIIGAAAYAIVGIALPMYISKQSAGLGGSFRQESGALSSFVLDSLRGLPEIMQYNQGDARLRELDERTDSLSKHSEALNNCMARSASYTNTVILSLDLCALFCGCVLFVNGQVNFDGLVLPVVALMSSFGPVIALANLGSGLQNTFAAGNRVLDILDETPQTAEICDKPHCDFEGAAVNNVTFSYGDETILKDVSAAFPPNTIVGLNGKSGSGKSTLLKLLMRFWETTEGSIEVSGRNINEVNTRDLRNMQSYVTQETHLFHDSIANNLRIAKPDATQEELVEACKKAAVHDFIMTLPQGYDTNVGELGGTLSGGEKQRLGLARAFLHDAPMVLLDEPTSNLDSLNEAVILKSIDAERANKTVVLVSHRASTMAITDKVYSVEHGRVS